MNREHKYAAFSEVLDDFLIKNDKSSCCCITKTKSINKVPFDFIHAVLRSDDCKIYGLIRKSVLPISSARRFKVN